MKKFFMGGLFILSALSACASPHDNKQGHAAPPHLLYSPNGDPLNGGPLGKPTCQDAMARWFDRVDTNHDAAITEPEFLVDASAQFQRMDIDKKGYLVSEEVERFRMPYREISVAAPAEETDSTPAPARGRGRRHNGENSGDKKTEMEGGLDFVMSADTNLDYKVTPDEFMAHARKKFTELDSDRNDSLNKMEVSATCEQK